MVKRDKQKHRPNPWKNPKIGSNFYLRVGNMDRPGSVGGSRVQNVVVNESLTLGPNFKKIKKNNSLRILLNSEWSYNPLNHGFLSPFVFGHIQNSSFSSLTLKVYKTTSRYKPHINFVLVVNFCEKYHKKWTRSHYILNFLRAFTSKYNSTMTLVIWPGHFMRYAFDGWLFFIFYFLQTLIFILSWLHKVSQTNCCLTQN